MREKFTQLKAGDPLSARRINRLGAVAARFAGMKTGPRIVARHSASTLRLSTAPEREVGVFEIYDTKIDAEDTDDSGLYRGKMRWYSTVNERWEEDDKEWFLDGSDLGLTDLSAGDKVTAFWHYQRGMFVPMSANVGTANIIKFSVDEAGGVEYTDPTFGIDNITVLSPAGASEFPGGSEPSFVNNLLGFPAEDDADGIAFYNPDSGLWEGIPAPSITECEENSSSSSLFI